MVLNCHLGITALPGTSLVVFLGELPSNDDRVSTTTAEAALSFWQGLRRRLARNVPEPMAFGTEEGAVQFAWRTERGIVSVNITEAGQCEWFARTRGTPVNDFEEHEGRVSDAPPEWFAEKLARL